MPLPDPRVLCEQIADLPAMIAEQERLAEDARSAADMANHKLERRSAYVYSISRGRVDERKAKAAMDEQVDQLTIERMEQKHLCELHRVEGRRLAEDLNSKKLTLRYFMEEVAHVR